MALLLDILTIAALQNCCRGMHKDPLLPPSSLVCSHSHLPLCAQDKALQCEYIENFMLALFILGILFLFLIMFLVLAQHKLAKEKGWMAALSHVMDQLSHLARQIS